MPSASSAPVLVLVLALAPAPQEAVAERIDAAAAQGRVRIVVQSSPLAGFRHHEAAVLWPALAVGDALELVREPDNPHDARAVRIDWRGRKLGYVPRHANDALAWALDRGERLQARISRLDAHRPPSRRLEFEVSME